MKAKHLFTLFIVAIFLLQNCNTTKQVSNSNKNNDSSRTERGDYRIMFYNCENLFDIEDDSLKNDDEFTPDGDRHWSWYKFEEKLGHIARVITSVGGWEPPEVVGLCEIENYYVLQELTKKSPLKVFNYKIIHYESPDKRGIDVALLYIPGKFEPIATNKFTVNFPEKIGTRPTRDILYVKGLTSRNDTLHIFVNHWPSRWGGMLETEPKRMFVASLLRKKVDSVFTKNNNAKIVIMGDLNDFPTNKSLTQSLKVLNSFDNIKNDELYSLSFYLQEEKGLYSHKYHGESGILDHIIVSGALLDTNANIFTTKDNADIYNAEFLLEKDKNYVGYKPFRTFIGFKYNGGYSDHLPTYLDLFFKEN